MSTFKAFRVFDEGEVFGGRVVDATLDELTAGDVVIRAAYSSVNFKDAMTATQKRDPGDITTIEDEGSVDEARHAWAQMKEEISSQRR